MCSPAGTSVSSTEDLIGVSYDPLNGKLLLLQLFEHNYTGPTGREPRLKLYLTATPSNVSDVVAPKFNKIWIF